MDNYTAAKGQAPYQPNGLVTKFHFDDGESTKGLAAGHGISIKLPGYDGGAMSLSISI
jgi:hypothetical protein